jgi:hypothetical protein
MVDSQEQPLRGVKKKVRIIFVIENLKEMQSYTPHYPNFGKSKSCSFPLCTLVHVFTDTLLLKS